MGCFFETPEQRNQFDDLNGIEKCLTGKSDIKNKTKNNNKIKNTIKNKSTHSQNQRIKVFQNLSKPTLTSKSLERQHKTNDGHDHDHDNDDDDDDDQNNNNNKYIYYIKNKENKYSFINNITINNKNENLVCQNVAKYEVLKKENIFNIEGEQLNATKTNEHQKDEREEEAIIKKKTNKKTFLSSNNNNKKNTNICNAKESVEFRHKKYCNYNDNNVAIKSRMELNLDLKQAKNTAKNLTITTPNITTTVTGRTKTFIKTETKFITKTNCSIVNSKSLWYTREEQRGQQPRVQQQRGQEPVQFEVQDGNNENKIQKPKRKLIETVRGTNAIINVANKGLNSYHENYQQQQRAHTKYSYQFFAAIRKLMYSMWQTNVVAKQTAFVHLNYRSQQQKRDVEQQQNSQKEQEHMADKMIRPKCLKKNNNNKNNYIAILSGLSCPKYNNDVDEKKNEKLKMLNSYCSSQFLRHTFNLYAASSMLLMLCLLITTTTKLPAANAAFATGTSSSSMSSASESIAPGGPTFIERHPIFDESSSDKEILDLLLEKKRYDKRLLPPVNACLIFTDEDFCCGLSSPDMAKNHIPRRPHKRGTLTVNVNVLLLSLASPDESSLKYEVEFLLNQQWNDPRLQYGNKSHYDFLNALHHHDSIWTPDTYFIMHGDFKDPIIPMHFALRIYRNGTITYAMRRHLILSCQGSLHIFPFDDPKCSFSMESISYEEAQIKYVWKNDEDTLRKSPSLTTLNAYLIKNQTTACDQNSWRGKFM